MIHFEPTVNLGTLLVGTGVILTVLKMHRDNVRSLALLQQKVNMIWNWYKKEHKIDDDNDDYIYS